MTNELRMDFGRMARVGITEAVLCAGKTAAQIAVAMDQARANGTPLLLTRLDSDALAGLDSEQRGAIDYDAPSATGIFGDWKAPGGSPRVAIVTAGSSDLGVAHEAARTLSFHGHASHLIGDIGVAGLWRLLERQDELRDYPVIIAIAGMDGALFSVLGGLIGGLLIAVPTSTGYGAARGGETSLHSALASCAAGVVAVNIDNGYGAACAALRALNMYDTHSLTTPTEGNTP
jgi:NCAIR mutase (PurE)-related protein